MSGPIVDPTTTEPATPRHQQAQAHPLPHHQNHHQRDPATKVDTAKDTSDDNLHPAPRFSTAVPFPPQTPVMPHPDDGTAASASATAAAAAAPGVPSSSSDDGAAMDVDHTTPRAATSLQYDGLDALQQPPQAHQPSYLSNVHGYLNGAPIAEDDDIPIFLSTPVQTDEASDKVDRLQQENSMLRQQLARSYKQMEELKSLRTSDVEAMLRDHREISAARYEVSESRRLELEQLKSTYEARILDLERELSHFRTGGPRPAPAAPGPSTPSSTGAAAPADPASAMLLNIAEQLSGMMLEMPQPGVINVAQQPSYVPDGVDPQSLTFAFQLIQRPQSAGETTDPASQEEVVGAGSNVRYLYKPVYVPAHMADFFKVETEVEQDLLSKFYSRMLQDLVPVDE